MMEHQWYVKCHLLTLLQSGEKTLEVRPSGRKTDLVSVGDRIIFRDSRSAGLKLAVLRRKGYENITRALANENPRLIWGRRHGMSDDELRAAIVSFWTKVYGTTPKPVDVFELGRI